MNTTRVLAGTATGRRGFTLIELMVVLAIAAILASLAAPSFREYIDRSRLRSAAETLANEISFARSEAVRRDTTVYMPIGTGSGSCWGIGETSGCTCSNCNLRTVDSNAFETAYPGMRISSTTLATLPFASTRADLTSTQTIVVSSAATSRTISVVIKPLGTVKVCSNSNLPGIDACS